MTEHIENKTSIAQKVGFEKGSSQKKSIHDSISEMLNLSKNLDSLTELDQNESTLMSIIEWMAERYTSSALTSFCLKFKINKVPLARKRSKEYVEIMQKAYELAIAEERSKTMQQHIEM